MSAVRSVLPRPLQTRHVLDTEPSPPPEPEGMTELERFAAGLERRDLSGMGLAERLIFGRR